MRNILSSDSLRRALLLVLFLAFTILVVSRFTNAAQLFDPVNVVCLFIPADDPDNASDE